jgi:hypothetical protein
MEYIRYFVVAVISSPTASSQECFTLASSLLINAAHLSAGFAQADLELCLDR